MSGVQARGPAGMIDGNIEKEFGIAGMHSIHEFDKLFQGRGLGVKFGKRRIDGDKT